MSQGNRSSSETSLLSLLDPQDRKELEKPTTPVKRSRRKRGSGDTATNLFQFMSPDDAKVVEASIWVPLSRRRSRRRPGPSSATAPDVFELLAAWQATHLKQQQAELDALRTRSSEGGATSDVGQAKEVEEAMAT